MSTCPNKDLLSAYIDDELPSPWKEKIEQHIKECNACRQVYRQYTVVNRCLQTAAAGHSLDTAESFAKLIVKRDTALQVKRELQKRRWAIAPGDRWFSSSIRVPMPVAAAALVLFVLMPLILFFKMDDAVSSVTVSQSSFTPILPVSLEKFDLLSEIDYGISQVNNGQSYVVSNRAVNANVKLFTVGEFARLYSKNKDMFQPVQAKIDLKISSSSFPLSGEYQELPTPIVVTPHTGNQ